MDIEREVRSVLDEPAPPPPPEPREDDGRGEGGPHTHFVMPLVIFHEDGAIATGDWRGTVLVLAYNLAAFVVVWQAIQQLSAWLPIAAARWSTMLDLVGLALIGMFVAGWLIIAVTVFYAAVRMGAYVGAWLARRKRGRAA